MVSSRRSGAPAPVRRWRILVRYLVRGGVENPKVQLSTSKYDPLLRLALGMFFSLRRPGQHSMKFKADVSVQSFS